MGSTTRPDLGSDDLPKAITIPKGFQPIAGGEHRDTTGQRIPDSTYPEGIAALRSHSTRLASLRDGRPPIGWGGRV